MFWCGLKTNKLLLMMSKRPVLRCGLRLANFYQMPKRLVVWCSLLATSPSHRTGDCISSTTISILRCVDDMSKCNNRSWHSLRVRAKFLKKSVFSTDCDLTCQNDCPLFIYRYIYTFIIYTIIIYISLSYLTFLTFTLTGPKTILRDCTNFMFFKKRQRVTSSKSPSLNFWQFYSLR